ncbi:unnamed protein product [Arctogadus glacialis]
MYKVNWPNKGRIVSCPGRIISVSDNREELVCKRRHYLDGGDKLSSPEEKGNGKRKKLKNGRYSDDHDDDDDDDVVSLMLQS